MSIIPPLPPTPPQDPNHLQGKRVLVMGLGLLGGGVSTVRYALSQGAEVTVTDLRDEALLAPSIAQLEGLPVRYVLGSHDEADFRAADVVVRNPNVKRWSPYLKAARDAGVRIEMEIGWFFRACPGRIIGITGTRGKTTTTRLIYALLNDAGWPTLLGGNLGDVQTMSLLAHATADSWVVLELGNWMLEGLHTIERSPQVSVFTNLMPDHLDSYDSMEDYGKAKTAIFRYQRPGDLALFNAENDFTARYAAEAPSEHVWLYAPDQSAWWPRETPTEKVPFRYGDDVRLRGAHNLGNVQAATSVAELLGIAEASIHKTVAAFGGVPHRLEVVRELDGVTWVNDSASTAPMAGVAALRSFHEPVVLIAGGNTKKLDFTEFADEAASRAKKVVILAGTASDAFADAVRAAATAAGKPDLVVGPLPALDLALREARAAATPGDIVLLSPGFTSFGLFLHEFDRGDKFRAAVLAMS